MTSVDSAQGRTPLSTCFQPHFSKWSKIVEIKITTIASFCSPAPNFSSAPLYPMQSYFKRTTFPLAGHWTQPMASREIETSMWKAKTAGELLPACPHTSVPHPGCNRVLLWLPGTAHPRFPLSLGWSMMGSVEETTTVWGQSGKVFLKFF